LKYLVKFGEFTDDGDKKIEYGYLVVPDDYPSNERPGFSRTRQMLKFIEPMLDVQAIVVLGFYNPSAT
jgi:hypothetical protein